MDKIDLMRILECVLLYFDETTEIEINKFFNFKEMDKARKILIELKEEKIKK